MLTPEQLQEIERRVQMARPGPWQFREGTSVKGSIVGNGWHVDLISDDYEARASVNFIAHSRQDVPVLLAEVKHLQAEIEQLRKAEAWTIGFLERWARAIRDELGRLKGERQESSQ